MNHTNLIKEKLESQKNKTLDQITISDEQLKQELKNNVVEKFQLNEKMLEQITNSVETKYDYYLNDINNDSITSYLSWLNHNKLLDSNKIQFYEKYINDKSMDINKIASDIQNDIDTLKQKEIIFSYFQWFDAIRKKYIDEILEKMKLIESMSKKLKTFSNLFGRFWCLSEHDLYKIDNNFIYKLEAILNQNNFVQRIAQILGRLASSQNKFEKQLIKETILVPSKKKFYYSPENITSIEFGNDLRTILKHQLAYRHYHKMKKIFDANYIEKKLLQLQQKSKSFDEIQTTKTINKKIPEDKGPFVLCIDTSGSMHGEPETIAKALALAIFKIANRENRKCHIINFSTGITEFDASDVNKDFSKFYDFLSMSFSGGTDVQPALRAAVDKTKKEDYKNADIIVVSDFIINSLGEELETKIKNIKKNKVRIHALCIGDSQIKKHMEVFDTNMVYNGTQESIDNIIDVLNNVSDKHHNQ